MNAQQLKNSILQRAIEGKLVEQRPEEGTAAELLRKIKAEKARLVKEGKLKKEKPLPEIKAEEKPFEIPESWVWVRWGDLSQSIQYGYNAPAKENGRIKMVRISDIHNNKIIWDTVPYCDISESDIETYRLEKNDILFARTGGTVGKSYLVSDSPEEAIYAGYLIRTRYSSLLIPRYLKYFMESHLYWIQLRSGTIATAQPNCNGKTLSKMILPLPPLAEQKRIVAKIEELLPHIEQYGKAHDALTALNEKFPDAMKKSVLQYAMEGKLVEQREEEETAAELLREIKAEKARLVKEGKLKKEKPLPEIKAEEIPFEIPTNWKWVRLGDICVSIADGDHQPPPQTQNGIPFLVISNVSSGKLSFENTRFVPLAYYSSLQYGLIPAKGDILFTVTGSYGIPVLIDTERAFCFQRHISLLKLHKLDGQFFAYWLSSYSIKSQCDLFVTGTAQKTLSLGSLKSLLYPLPPLAEQKRIVSKLTNLFLIEYRKEWFDVH